MSGLSHLDSEGAARMVDVSGKPDSAREAIAEGFIAMAPEVIAAIRAGDIKKGDVLGAARVAGIMAAKRTSDLIPLCHPLPIDAVEVRVTPKSGAIRVVAIVSAHWRTGVEMEALCAANAAALTVYDMTKAIDRSIVIDGVRLLKKTGGRSGSWTASGA